MAEKLYIPQTESREERYRTLIPQIKALIASEDNLIANLANVTAAIHQTFGFFWVGFYLIKNDELVLGPFQGPIACTRIQYGKGVCGTAWQQGKTILVPDVDQFPGHIACSAQSKSEIVVPVFSDSRIIGLLDIDSDQLKDFTTTDQQYIEEICRIIGQHPATQNTHI